MKTIGTFTKGQQIPVGNFTVSIGIFDTSDVAIISNTSGQFVQKTPANFKRSRKLRRVRKHLNTWASCKNTFNFQFMTPRTTCALIAILQNKPASAITEILNS